MRALIAIYGVAFMLILVLGALDFFFGYSNLYPETQSKIEPMLSAMRGIADSLSSSNPIDMFGGLMINGLALLVSIVVYFPQIIGTFIKETMILFGIAGSGLVNAVAQFITWGIYVYYIIIVLEWVRTGITSQV